MIPIGFISYWKLNIFHFKILSDAVKQIDLQIEENVAINSLKTKQMDADQSNGFHASNCYRDEHIELRILSHEECQDDHQRSPISLSQITHEKSITSYFENLV